MIWKLYPHSCIDYVNYNIGKRQTGKLATELSQDKSGGIFSSVNKDRYKGILEYIRTEIIYI